MHTSLTGNVNGLMHDYFCLQNVMETSSLGTVIWKQTHIVTGWSHFKKQTKKGKYSMNSLTFWEIRRFERDEKLEGSLDSLLVAWQTHNENKAPVGLRPPTNTLVFFSNN